MLDQSCFLYFRVKYHLSDRHLHDSPVKFGTIVAGSKLFRASCLRTSTLIRPVRRASGLSPGRRCVSPRCSAALILPSRSDSPGLGSLDPSAGVTRRRRCDHVAYFLVSAVGEHGPRGLSSGVYSPVLARPVSSAQVRWLIRLVLSAAIKSRALTDAVLNEIETQTARQ